MESFFTDLPTLPPISKSTPSEDKMLSSTSSTTSPSDHDLSIQPLNLAKYRLPSSSSSQLSSPVQMQLSNDRSRCQQGGGGQEEQPRYDNEVNNTCSPPSTNFSYSPPQSMQTSYSAPPSATAYQPSFAFTLNNQLPQTYNQRRNHLQPPQPGQQQYAQPEPQASTTLNPNQNSTWPERGFNTQVYEPPYLQSHSNSHSHSLSPYKSGSNDIHHNHSHSTPNFFSTPYQSHATTPYQTATSLSVPNYNHNSQFSLTPYQLPVDLQNLNDIPLPLQPNECTDYSLPEGKWESNAPYFQGTHRDITPSSPLSERRMKKREALVKCRKHICPVCDKRFNRPSSLNTHMAVHTGAKPYICSRPECQRRFSVSSNLRRHERTHEIRAEKERQGGIPSTRLDEVHQQQRFDSPVNLNYLRPNQATTTAMGTPFSQPIQNASPFSFTYSQPNSGSYSSSLSMSTSTSTSDIYQVSAPAPAPAFPQSQFGSFPTSYSSTGSMTSGLGLGSGSGPGSNSSFDSNYGPTPGGLGGLSQYQLVTRKKNLTDSEMPRKGFVSLNDVDLEMDTKAGLLLA